MTDYILEKIKEIKINNLEYLKTDDFIYFKKEKIIDKEKIIYNIENRGVTNIDHWFFFMLAGLKDIFNGTPILKGSDSDGKYFLDSNVKNRNIKHTFPIKVCFNNIEDDFLPFHYETLRLLSDKIEMVEIKNINKKNIINSYGSRLIDPFIDGSYYHFLRNLFLENKNYKYDNKKFIFISSKNSKYDCSYNYNRKKLFDEKELMENYFYKLGFELIHLEDYNIEEIIKIFNTSSIIISSFGGELIYNIFANNLTTIIDIIPKNCYHQGYYNQKKHIISTLELSYIEYNDSNINPLINIIKKLI